MSFPFEELPKMTVNLKHAPIEVNWHRHRRDLEDSSSSKERPEERWKKAVPKVGQEHQRPWFQTPPKVHIIPGILGLGLEVETRDIHLVGGEHKIEGDLESGHLYNNLLSSSI
jgi:hypothetical protein